MNQTTQKSLILSLIKDDLTATKLLDGLSALGLSSDSYMLGIMDSVMLLIGLEKPIMTYDGLFERYLEISGRLKDLDITQSRKPLDALSMEIYQEIQKHKHPVPVL